MNKRKNDDIHGQRKRKNDEPRIGDFFEEDYEDVYDDDDDSDIPRSRKVSVDEDEYQEYLEFKRWKKMKNKATKIRKKRRYHKGESLLKKLWDLID